MKFTILNRVLIVAVIGWIASCDGTELSPPIRNSEIKPGVLVFFERNRVQKSADLNQRAMQLDMQLARIMDPPFNANRTRVNIEKVLNPSIVLGVKSKHLIMAKSIFDDESALAPSPNQKLELEIFKIPSGQPVGEAIIKQIILANRLEHCDRAFLMHRTLTADMMRSVLLRTAKCSFSFSNDLEEIRFMNEEECLVRFLDKITSPSHLDNDTLDDFRELVAQNVFSFYNDYDVETFEETINYLSREEGTTKSSKILRIFYMNLLRDQPRVCPKLEVMRDDFVDFNMVEEMLVFIWRRYIFDDSSSTVNYLPTLYKLMDSNATITRAMWDWGVTDTENQIRLCAIADYISRKIGLETGSEARYSNEQVLRIVTEMRNALNREWNIYMRVQVFGAYWQELYELKRSGFSGRIAIVNRDYILDDSWIQSLFGIFGRDNTVIERVTEL